MVVPTGAVPVMPVAVRDKAILRKVKAKLVVIVVPSIVITVPISAAIAKVIIAPVTMLMSNIVTLAMPPV